MIKFKLQLKGLEKGQEITKDKAKRILMKCMFKMEELAIRYAPVDQGFLRLNISLFPQVLSENYVLISKANYSEPLEYGTRPFYAPIAPLKAWASRKIGDESLGYAIQKKIAMYGIKSSPFMRPAYNQVINFWYDFYTKEEFRK